MFCAYKIGWHRAHIEMYKNYKETSIYKVGHSQGALDVLKELKDKIK